VAIYSHPDKINHSFFFLDDHSQLISDGRKATTVSVEYYCKKCHAYGEHISVRNALSETQFFLSTRSIWHALIRTRSSRLSVASNETSCQGDRSSPVVTYTTNYGYTGKQLFMEDRLLDFSFGSDTWGLGHGGCVSDEMWLCDGLRNKIGRRYSLAHQSISMLRYEVYGSVL
jgi:hypothetical protein